MHPLDFSIKIKNYKCFGEEEQGFDKIYPINIIIGRNNSGKSALLDVVQFFLEFTNVSANFSRNGSSSELLITKDLTLQEIEKAFSKSHSAGGVPGMNHYEYGIRWLNKLVTLRRKDNQHEFFSINPPFDLPDSNPNLQSFKTAIQNSFINPLNGKAFKRLLADRDVKPEGDGPIRFESNGEGASNIIAHFLNMHGANSGLVEKELLKGLNYIFAPESKFERILSKKIANGGWSILLEESHKGSVLLSDFGSGLKTVILVLILLLLIPSVESKNLDNYVFGLEELENNLHPALQRKLFTYIKNIAEERGCTFFITTHSNVVIDMFANDPIAQIIYIKNDGTSATVNKVQTNLDAKGVLDDMDFRASDLLQSNGIVWVEGPSDRVYVNRWIELVSGAELKEGIHYQCVFYGGKLLAHLTADEDNEDGVSILKVNTNCVLLMDSDKKSEKDDINNTKKRIRSEIESVNGLVWLTGGNEVENYIPSDALKEYFERDDLQDLGLFEEFADYLDYVEKGQGKKFLRNKVYFSEKIVPLITLNMVQSNGELIGNINKLCDRIKAWNKII